jgi:pyrroline-5-carboxylate reductase
MKKYKVVIIGSGNVAYHLIRSVTGAGHKIMQIYNRTLANIHKTDKIEVTDKILNITTDADIYIICVKDEAIELLAKDIRLKDKLIVHTSGTTSMNLLQSCSTLCSLFLKT